MNISNTMFSIDVMSSKIKKLMVSHGLTKAMTMIIIVFIFVMLINFGWKLWEFFQPQDEYVVSPIEQVSDNNTFNLRKFHSYHLFGNVDFKESTQATEIEAPITRLKLKLRGVYSASDDSLAGAMIEAQNKQQVYRVGQSLPGAKGLKLHQIMSDRVIMSRNGKYETLLIEDFSGKFTKVINDYKPKPFRITNSGADISPKSTVDKRNDKNLSRELIKLRSNLSDPQSLNELVTVTPAMKDDEFLGFRLAPGKNRALFARMGLRRNDLVTQVNGISLESPASALSLMQEISTADEINLEVKRGSRNINILFSASP